MQGATISADIIAYTSLSQRNKRLLEEGIKGLISQFSETYSQQKFLGRLVQGDYIECAMVPPQEALRIALILKTFVKSFPLDLQKKTTNYKYFQTYGLRLALSVASLSVLDPNKGIIDGEAIYESGRALQHKTTSDKQKANIKNTLFFYSSKKNTRVKYEVILALIDEILNKNSSKQCEVIFYKLMRKSEKEITQILGKSQSTISQHSTAGGWNAIEKAVNYFEKTIQ